MKKIVLVDGNNLIFRSYFATAYTGNLMRNSKGLHTNALYGFTNMINKILKDEKPEYILVAFDKGKTFRHDEFDGYKGGRAKTPEELIEQFPYSKQLLEKMGVKWAWIDNYEADDIIGTLSKEADATGEYKTVIISSDKDLLQLISDTTTVKLISKGDFINYTPELLLEKLEVTPDQIKDLKGLEGDKSDNIPGVPGVGAKTALKLLKEYGNIENIYENIENIKGKLKERLEDNKEMAIKSKSLATIHTKVPIDIKLSDIIYKGVNYEGLIELYRHLEFNSFLKRLEAEFTLSESMKDFKETDVEVVDTFNEDLLEDGSSVIVEVYGDNYHNAKILGLGVYNSKGKYYIPFDALVSSGVKKLDLSNALTYDIKRTKVALMWQGIDISGITFDAMLASYITNPSTRSDMASIAEHFGSNIPYIEQIYGKGAKKKIPSDDIIAKYVADKAEFIYRNKEQMLNELSDNEELDLFNNIEVPLAYVLADMEFEGINLDSDELKKQGHGIKEKINELESNIHELAGETFNIGSPKQLGVILFEKLELPVIKKTKTGYSTAQDVLEKLVDKHPVIEKVMEYRTLTKLHSTYIEGLLNYVFNDGKIHTIFNQALTQTGRLSSTEPNIQNIPVRTNEGRLIRKAFVASKGRTLLAADYSQIELRVLAHISKADNLMEAFRNDMDIHTKTAMDIYGVSMDEVTSNMRRNAKAVNFGIVYGISGFGLSQNLDIDIKEAKSFIATYLHRFPGVKQYMDDIISSCKKTGYVETIMNRKRYIPEINSSNFVQRGFGERIALNTPIQGSAADIIKKAMIDIDSKIKELNLSSKLLIQVHDELIFDCLESEKEIMEKLVIETMENTIKLEVPLKVDYNFGYSWYDAK